MYVCMYVCMYVTVPKDGKVFVHGQNKIFSWRDKAGNPERTLNTLLPAALRIIPILRNFIFQLGLPDMILLLCAWQY